MLVGASKSISGFDPRSIVGCSLWLDGADTATMNSTPTVSLWTDKSGQGNNVTGTATYSSGTITFNGTNQAFSNTAYVFPSNAYSMFAVYSNTTAPASTAYMNVVYGSGGYPMLGVYGSSKFVSARSVVANTGALSPNIVASNVLVGATYTPSTFSPFINGSAETTLAGTTLAATGIYVGGPTNYFNGSVSEILIYSATLTQTQRQSVEGYLSWKWGLQVQVPAPVQTPLSISSCVLWLDAADASTVTGTSTVTAWRDKSSKGYSLVPGSGTTSYASNAIAINSSYLYGSGAVDLTSFTFFIVVKTITTNGNQPYFAARGGGDTAISKDGFGWYMDNGNQTRFMGNYSVSGQYILTTGLVTSNTALYSITGTSAGVYTQWNNGVLGSNATYGPRTTGGQGFMVGAEYGGTSYYTYTNSGSIYEIIVFNSVLSTTQRQQVENYLMGKWGIKPSLPAIHPFYSLPAFSRVFTPVDIPGCALWLDGADASTMNSTTTVTSWTDKSSLGNTMTGTATFSGSNMTFNGSTQAFSNTSFVFPISNYSMFAVYSNTTAPASTAYMNVVYGNGGYPMLGIYGYLKAVSARSVVANTGALSPNVAASSTVLVSATYTPSTFSPFINGSAETTLAGTTLAATGIYVGGPTNYFNGSVSEILIYSSNLSSTQRQTIEGYLTWKWGLRAQFPSPVSTPLSISGCALWLDGADPAGTGVKPSVGATVSSWVDKSGSGNTVTCPSSTYSSNSTTGQTGIFFNNSATSALTLSPYCSFFVSSYNTGPNFPTSYPGLLGSVAVVLFGNYYLGSNGYGAGGGWAPDRSVNSYGAYLADSRNIAVNSVAAVPPAAISVRVGAGDSYPGGNQWIGHIYEVIVYNQTLTTSQRQSVENYLMKKWGINLSLPTTHPFYSIPPSTSQPPQFQEVTPGNWNYDWKPYLQSLAAANSSGVTVTTSNITGGATFTSNGWVGGVLAPNGNIYFAPFVANNILVLNPTTGVTSNLTGGATYTTYGWTKGVLAPNGNIYFCPNSASNILVLNPTTGVTSNLTGGANYAGGWFGGVLAPNGNIYFAPGGAANILVLNPTTGVTSNITGGATFVTNGWNGGVLAPNGNIYFCPFVAANVLVLNPTTGVTSNLTGGATYTSSGWTGGVLAPNGNIYFGPYVAQNVLVLNPTTGVTSNLTGGFTYTGGYAGGVLAPNGNIYFCPQDARNVLVLNPTTGVTSNLTGGATFPAVGASWYAGVLALDGNIYFTPQQTPNILTVKFAGLSQLPSSNYCLSAWTNKF